MATSNNPCANSVPCTQFTDSQCIIYTGPTLSCLGVITNDSLSTVLDKINSKAFTITSSTLAVTTTTVSGCKVVNIEFDGGSGVCLPLVWLDLDINSPFVSGGDIILTVEGTSPVNLGDSQQVQYAVDPCNNKIWFRGIIQIPANTITSTTADLVATLPFGNLYPLKTRLTQYMAFAGSGFYTPAITIKNTGEIYFSAYLFNDSPQPGYFSLDGFSIETN